MVRMVMMVMIRIVIKPLDAKVIHQEYLRAMLCAELSIAFN